MQVKTKGIVLHTLKYNDSSLIVEVYTERCGRVSFVVAIPKSHKARVKNMLFAPLSILEIDFDQRPNATLQRVKDVRCSLPFVSLPYHPVKSAIALFLAEFLHRALRDEVVDAPLFTYLTASIEWLDASVEHFANFHLVFLMRLSRFLGFYPNVDDYHAGDYFDLLNSCFVDRQPFHAAFVRPQEAEHISMLMRMNYETMHLFELSGVQRMRCLEVLNDYYRLHIPDFPELKSLSVLKEVFH